MKKAFKPVLAVLVILALAFSFTACGQSSSSAGSTTGQPAAQSTAAGSGDAAIQPAKDIKLTMWDQVHVTTDEQKKPVEEWYISKAIERFKKDNPGVSIAVSTEADASQVIPKLKAAGLAKNGPDIANVWSGMYVSSLKDVVLPLDGKVPQEDLDNISGWEYVRYNFQPDGAILAYPVGGRYISMFYYNKKVIKDCGLDFEANPPRTAADFDAALEKIKAKGYIPIVDDEGQSKNLLYHIANYWWGQSTGSEGIAKHNSGEVKFADDQGLINALTYYQSLYKNGYVNKDTASSSDQLNKFYQGKAALTVGGSWGFTDATQSMGDNLGIVRAPNINDSVKVKDGQMGGPGDAMVVSNYSENPDMAIKFLHYLSSKQETLEYLKTSKVIPVRKDITPAELGWNNDPILSKSFEWANNCVYWVDNTVDSDAMSELAKMCPLVLTGKMTPQEAAAKMDEKMAEKGK